MARASAQMAMHLPSPFKAIQKQWIDYFRQIDG